MSGNKAPSSSDPWDALFASATRPQTAPVATPSSIEVNDNYGATSSTSDNNPSAVSAAAGGYTILMQHSMTPKSQRQCALSSTATTSASSSHNPPVSSMASLALRDNRSQHPSARQRPVSRQGGWFGMAGPFLVRQAFDELCRRCEGAVIFVSTLGASGVLDVERLDAIFGGDERRRIRNAEAVRKRRNALQMFRRSGAMVDLSSDPFGWDEDDNAGDDSDISCDDGALFVQTSTIDNLKSIALAIRRAADRIESCRSDEKNVSATAKGQTTLQPIPIVFESMSPILNLHGVEGTSLLIKSLGRLKPRSPANIASSANLPILSPIVVPVLYESMSPSQHRCLEDIADSIIHLNLNIGGIVSAAALDEYDSKIVMSGVMDMMRRGGGGRGGGGGLGGKLIHHRLPVQIMRSSTNPCVDDRDNCYWVLDSGTNEESEANNEPERNQPMEPFQGTNVGGNHSSSASDAVPSRPRIYLQDDDPEYDDYDEEDDLDDDLDL